MIGAMSSKQKEMMVVDIMTAPQAHKSFINQVRQVWLVARNAFRCS